MWLILFPAACLQACHLAISINEEDPTAIKLLDTIERFKIKAGLGVSPGASTKEESHNKLLQTQPAVVRGRQLATATSPEAVCAQGGSSCATQPGAQPLEGLQQAVEEPNCGPETSKTQKVMRPAALRIQTILPVHHVCMQPSGKLRAQGSVAAALQMCLFVLLAEVAGKPAGAEAASDKTATARCMDENVSALVRFSQLAQQLSSPPSPAQSPQKWPTFSHACSVALLCFKTAAAVMTLAFYVNGVGYS